MQESITYVGMDDHKNSINIAALLPSGELYEWRIANQERAIRRWVKKLNKVAVGPIECCYEAGPGGFVLQRRLENLGVKSQVVAPSRTPRRPGDRIKTNRRDALKLAKFLGAGLLEEVLPPTQEQEAHRELCRCRGTVQQDLTRSRHRVTKFLLRRGVSYPRRNWTQGHRRWLRSLRFEQYSDQQVFESYLWSVEQLEQQRAYLDGKLQELAQEPEYREAVGQLRCFRGIDTLTAIILVCELYSFGRFGSARGLMNFLGLVPGEDSTGDDPKRLGITKTGNTRVRRVLVEAAWHYRHRPAVGEKLKKRRAGQPSQALRQADKAMLRLHHRYWALVMKGKEPPKALVAVARELVGFLWALLYPQEALI